MTRDASLAPVTLSRLSHITESALIEAWPLSIGGGTRHIPGSLLQISRPVDPEPGPAVQTVAALWARGE